MQLPFRFHRPAPDSPATPRARLWLARALDHFEREADETPRRGLRSVRSPVRRSVARAVAPALHEIAGALRDEQVPVSHGQLGRLRRFLTDGVTSPLYRDNVIVARFEAERLRAALVPARPSPV